MVKKLKKNTQPTNPAEKKLKKALFEAELTANGQVFKAKGDVVLDVLNELNPVGKSLTFWKTRGKLVVKKGDRVFEKVLPPAQLRLLWNKLRIQFALKFLSRQIEFLLNR